MGRRILNIETREKVFQIDVETFCFLDRQGIICKKWKFLGLMHVKRTTWSIKAEEVVKLILEKGREAFPPYKNGNPQWTVLDLDHGTRRCWGNRSKRLWLSEE